MLDCFKRHKEYPASEVVAGIDSASPVSVEMVGVDLTGSKKQAVAPGALGAPVPLRAFGRRTCVYMYWLLVAVICLVTGFLAWCATVGPCRTGGTSTAATGAMSAAQNTTLTTSVALVPTATASLCPFTFQELRNLIGSLDCVALFNTATAAAVMAGNTVSEQLANVIRTVLPQTTNCDDGLLVTAYDADCPGLLSAPLSSRREVLVPSNVYQLVEQLPVQLPGDMVKAIVSQMPNLVPSELYRLFSLLNNVNMRTMDVAPILANLRRMLVEQGQDLGELLRQNALTF